LSVIMWVHSTL